MNILQKFHSSHYSHRTNIISSLIIEMLPNNVNILDIGCGDGTIDKKIIEKKPTIKIAGVDVLKQKKSKIPVVIFDGKKLPFSKNSFDGTLLIDMLHHNDDISALMKEAVRVSKDFIIIKDHYLQGKISLYILKLMDWLGNRPYNINLLYNYYDYGQWENLFKDLNLKKEQEINNLNLFSFPFTLIFDRDYHFIVKLRRINKKFQICK